MTGGHGTRASGGMLPTFAAESRLGTNPIAWAAPARNQHPFLFDVACTQIANNKVGLARRIGVPLEPGWITDTDGVPFNDPVPAARRVLSAAVWWYARKRIAQGLRFRRGLRHHVSNSGRRRNKWCRIPYVGGYHFFAAFQIAGFCDEEEFLDNMDDALNQLGERETRDRA